jgi:uncharacterized protein
MADQSLSDLDKKVLLKLARQTIELAAGSLPLQVLNLMEYSTILRENGASFVTLTKNRALRGCIGALEPYQPLVQDVCEHAAAAALQDPRFPPVRKQEVSLLQIEISRLTFPQPLEYASPDELPLRLRPGVDGVILRDGMRRATFLPQVWEQLPSPQEFLSHLCQKMGSSSSLWRQKVLRVSIYQVEEFSEEHFLPGNPL